MRKLYQGQLQNIPPELQSTFNEIFRASQDGDIVDIGQAFSITGTYTQTRALNVTSPTLANIAAVLATFLSDLQAGGATKTT